MALANSPCNKDMNVGIKRNKNMPRLHTLGRLTDVEKLNADLENFNEKLKNGNVTLPKGSSLTIQPNFLNSRGFIFRHSQVL